MNKPQLKAVSAYLFSGYSLDYISENADLLGITPETLELMRFLEPVRLSDWFPRPGGAFEAHIVMTPDVAADLEERNSMNRTRSDAQVRTIVNTLVEGRWVGNNPESVVVYNDGSVGDGQHRARAVIQAAQDMETLITLNVDVKLRGILGNGRSRSCSDQAKIVGHWAKHSDIAAVRALWQIIHESTSAPNIEPQGIFKLCDQYENVIKSLPAGSVMRKGEISAVRAMFCWTYMHWPEETKKFLAASRDAVGLQPDTGEFLWYRYHQNGTGEAYVKDKALKNAPLKEPILYKALGCFHLSLTGETQKQVYAAPKHAIELRKLINKNYKPKLNGLFCRIRWAELDKLRRA